MRRPSNPRRGAPRQRDDGPRRGGARRRAVWAARWCAEWSRRPVTTGPRGEAVWRGSG